MSNVRALKLAAGGLVLVGGALWFSPPKPLLDWLSPDVPVAVKQPTGSEPGSEEPAPVTVAINPLSGMKPEQFKETLDRPLFNPGRAGRPPEPEPEPEPEPQVTEEEPEPEPAIKAADLSLMAVAGEQKDLVAMVRWTKNNQVYRLKRGQFLSDLELVSVNLREATLKKDENVIVLSLFSKGKGLGDGGGVTPVSDDEEDGDAADEESDEESADEDSADEEDAGDDEDTSEDESTDEEDATDEEDTDDEEEAVDEEATSGDEETYDNEAEGEDQ